MLIGRSLSYEHADGRVQFSNLNFTVPSGGSALVGANGVGKSILARVLAGELSPSQGSVKADGKVLYLPQIESPSDATVGEFLSTLWETSSETQEKILKLLGAIRFESVLSHLSGGEWMRVRIARSLLQTWNILILDEPTNNLDQQARTAIAELLQNANFSFLLISHDRALLRCVNQIFELSNRGLQLYGGNYDLYAAEKVRERERGQELLQTAELQNKKRQIEKIEKIKAQEKRNRTAAAKAPDMGIPKIILGAMKRRAQQTTNKIKLQTERYVINSSEKLREAVEAQKKEKLLYFELPETYFPLGKQLLRLENFNVRFSKHDSWLWAQPLNLTLSGPVRIALKGPNGRGKSTLLKCLLGMASVQLTQGEAQIACVPMVYLDQSYALLDLSKTVLENIESASRFDPIETRNQLARFLFQKDQAYQPAATLSGGERLRACLAKSLLASSVPQILILDEPTNNLDLENLEFLEKVLRSYQGALIVVSHDEDFLKNIGCDQELKL